MTLPLTLIAMAVCAAIVGLAAWRANRPADPLRVRLVPWNLITVMVAGLFVLLLAHLFTYFGIEPGQGIPRL